MLVLMCSFCFYRVVPRFLLSVCVVSRGKKTVEEEQERRRGGGEEVRGGERR